MLRCQAGHTGSTKHGSMTYPYKNIAGFAREAAFLANTERTIGYYPEGFRAVLNFYAACKGIKDRI